MRLTFKLFCRLYSSESQLFLVEFWARAVPLERGVRYLDRIVPYPLPTLDYLTQTSQKLLLGCSVPILFGQKFLNA